MAIDPEDILSDWVRMNDAIMELTEAQVEGLLQYEKDHRARLRTMMRLYNRLSKLRSGREKVELAKCAKG